MYRGRAFSCQNPSPDDLLTVKEFAEETNYSEEHIRHLCRRSSLKATKLEHRWLIGRDELEAFLLRHSPEAQNSEHGSRLEKILERIVSTAPPLTDDSCDRLRELLSQCSRCSR